MALIKSDFEGQQKAISELLAFPYAALRDYPTNLQGGRRPPFPLFFFFSPPPHFTRAGQRPPFFFFFFFFFLVFRVVPQGRVGERKHSLIAFC